MNITVNLAAFRAELERGAEALMSGMERGVAEAAAQVERAAKQNLKGDARGEHLMKSIHSEVQMYYDFCVGRVGVGGATGIDGEAGENFGIYVHEGTGIYSRTGMGRKDVPWFYKDDWEQGHITSGMHANPFLEDAYNETAPRVAQIIAGKLTGGG